ncbi:MAG: 2-amino-4-hydroxy-6-hydroxymethyldihydropteridine diphosphokinase [Acidobacteria bacterium]|nr:2-amino-4-hydroxy-6-hydroxymethyldihydropteridine diphosphokinase [Acidobacteriota bacterium]
MRAFLGLGSNLGDRASALEGAIAALDGAGARVVSRSSVRETAPVGGPSGQPPYLNQVVEVACDLEPRALLALCHEIEERFGRDRAREERWGPRTLDLDVLVIEGPAIDEPGLVVPHPRLTERAFALGPLAEIAPDLDVPGLGCARDLLAALRRRGDPP